MLVETECKATSPGNYMYSAYAFTPMTDIEYDAMKS